jgi:hypothetical protein
MPAENEWIGRSPTAASKTLRGTEELIINWGEPLFGLFKGLGIPIVRTSGESLSGRRAVMCEVIALSLQCQCSDSLSSVASSTVSKWNGNICNGLGDLATDVSVSMSILCGDIVGHHLSFVSETPTKHALFKLDHHQLTMIFTVLPHLPLSEVQFSKQ